MPVVYSLELYARLIHRFIDRLGLQRPVLAGHSMGGKIAAAAAVLQPDRFSGLVLVNPGGFARSESLLPLLGRSAVAQRLLDNRWFNTNVLPITPWAQILATHGSRVQLRMLRHSHRLLDLRRAGFRDRLAGLQLPTLVLWGLDDRVLPRATPHRIIRFIPHARVRHIPGAGHVPMKDQPQRVAHEVARFAREMR